jgi:hypothetical protein
MFQLAKLPRTAQALPDVRVGQIPVDTGKIGQDMTLFLNQAERLSGRIRYNRDVLSPERVVHLRDRFLRILAAAITDPDRPLTELLRKETP